jgi:hypothetical protein
MTTAAAPPMADRMMQMRMIALRGMKLGLLTVSALAIVQLHGLVVVDVSVVVLVTVGGIAVEV